ncbi:uncharacterized protein LOC121368967 [Gigantopelta aegis]|uniref:uncharacterized protein LOC121368967 n=1 Tax=Gigantopelta aegis TaxID=1735272 RepID=UPI001B88ACD7|nr:uncharacterized protein LOC121368967 [Gigantopelta aegis]
MLWRKQFLGEDTPRQLLDTLVYLIGLNFALRAGDEHRFLRVGSASQFELLVGSSGEKSLKYTEDISKTNQGSLKHRKLERKSGTVSENHDFPERCLVRLFEKYISLKLKNGKCDSFYLRPLTFLTSDCCYADVPVGIHPLCSTTGRLCKAAGFTGYYTNHSLRATTATRLYESGIDEQLIAERTGHKSVAIRAYKRTSGKMASTVDNIIQRKSSRILDTKGKASATPLISHDVEEKAKQRDLCLKLGDGTTFSMKF